MLSKINTELNTLVEDKVISQDVANNIASYYAKKKTNKPNVLFTIFGVFGALFVGLGIILIVAHNWDDLSKSIKTILAFLPMLIGQCFVGYVLVKNKALAWRETSGTFLFFAIGSCMALISQIYNLPEDINSYLLSWTLLCIPLIYVLRSKAILILCLLFCTFYGCSYGYKLFNANQEPWWYLLMILATLPFYFYQLKTNSKSILAMNLNWLFPISFTLVLGAFVKSDALLKLVYMLLFGLFYNLGRLPVFYNNKIRQNGFIIIGSLGTIIVLLISSFVDNWEYVNRLNDTHSSLDILICGILFVLTSGLFLYPIIRSKMRDFSLFQLVFLLYAMVFLISQFNVIVAVVIVNILVFVLGVNAILIGVKSVNFGVLNYGLLTITAIVICRFFDMDLSFITRGLLFLICGVGFFITNYVMYKRIKNNQNSILKQ